MLTQLSLRHFKCFELLRLPLAPLTLLSGSNASGKSTVLQALVLLHQTIRDHEWSTRLVLNGSAISLGNVSDVVDKVNGRRTFEIGVVDGDLRCQWVFSGERSEMSMAVEQVMVGSTVDTAQEGLRYLLPRVEDTTVTSLAHRLRGLTYITAERVGPREVYSLQDRQVAPVVGTVGEYAASVLHWGRDEDILEGLALPGAASTLLRQVEARMGTFFPGFALTVQQVPQVNAVTLGLRTSEDTDFHRPVNVGFGLTQVLPIVIAILSARRDDIVLIENPEVHLHPAGQALVGQFLALAAQAGVQVIVETHSDHVLNGIRRSVKAGTISSEQIVMHFFKPRSANSAQVVSPLLDGCGNIDTWPDGFFDQFDIDMNYLAGWGD